MLGEKYTQYILNKGKLINKEIKNNIYTSDKMLLKLLLVDYVLETLRKYDARNCPNYKEDIQIPIIAEYDIDDPELEALITEDDINYIATEGDYNTYLFDQSYIEHFLTNLTKDIQC